MSLDLCQTSGDLTVWDSGGLDSINPESTEMGKKLEILHICFEMCKVPRTLCPKGDLSPGRCWKYLEIRNAMPLSLDRSLLQSDGCSTRSWSSIRIMHLGLGQFEEDETSIKRIKKKSIDSIVSLASWFFPISMQKCLNTTFVAVRQSFWSWTVWLSLEL